MNQRTILDILSGQKSGVGYSMLRAALSLARVPYSATMRARRWAYGRGLLPSHQAPGAVPVISIGNITTGGSGKTPMVEWLCAKLVESGRNPAILIRGYKDAGQGSDEAMLLEKSLGQSVPVIVGADRVASARRCVEMNVDTLVLDDGFQHLRLRRDMDIVLIDATNPFGLGKCLPRGLLRENVGTLKHAHAIVVTRSDAIDRPSLDGLLEHLKTLSPSAILCTAVHRPTGVVAAGRGEPVDALVGKKVFAFCGLGNPHGFFHTLRRLGCNVVEAVALDDHAQYDSQLLERLCSMLASRADAMVTTAKDAVKIEFSNRMPPMLALEVKMDIVTGSDEPLAAALSAGGD